VSDPIPFPLRWADASAPELAALAPLDPVAVLPLGAVEQHGPHLPVSTDLLIAEGVLGEAVARVPLGFPLVLLPPQALGASLEHTGIPGTLSLDTATVEGILLATGQALARHGIRRLVVFNTHGGNKHAVDAAALRVRAEVGLLVVKAHVFRFPRPPGVDLPESEWRHGLHGGAIETALLLHFRPDLVRSDRIARFASLGEELESLLEYLEPEGVAGFAWMAHDLNPEGVTGDATLATPAMGRRIAEHHGEVLAAVLRDARDFPLDRLVDRRGAEGAQRPQWPGASGSGAPRR